MDMDLRCPNYSLSSKQPWLSGIGCRRQTWLIFGYVGIWEEVP